MFFFNSPTLEVLQLSTCRCAKERLQESLVLPINLISATTTAQETHKVEWKHTSASEITTKTLQCKVGMCITNKTIQSWILSDEANFICTVFCIRCI